MLQDMQRDKVSQYSKPGSYYVWLAGSALLSPTSFGRIRTWHCETRHSQTVTATSSSVDRSLSFNLSFEVWQYVGILCSMLIGVRVLKYMRLHASLRIYSAVLSNTWK